MKCSEAVPQDQPDDGGQDERQQADLHPEQAPGDERRVEGCESHRGQHGRQVVGEMLDDAAHEIQIGGQEHRAVIWIGRLILESGMGSR